MASTLNERWTWSGPENCGQWTYWHLSFDEMILAHVSQGPEGLFWYEDIDYHVSAPMDSMKSAKAECEAHFARILEKSKIDQAEIGKRIRAAMERRKKG